jgi:hypothetical protein
VSALGSRYDAWVTREPDGESDEPVPHHCSQCGGFLKATPDSSENKDETRHCDGKPIEVISTYTDADAGTLDIIGWEHLGQSYTNVYDAECGESGEHEPHDFVVWAWVENHRRCTRCGHDNIEVDA